MRRHTDCPDALADHLSTRTPEWAAAITGLAVDEIEAFAALVGARKRSYFRLGYGFTRQRNGAVNMHAALSIASVTGAWAHEGGGAMHNNGAIYGWDKTLIEGLDAVDASTRILDQSQIGRVLTGDPEALRGGPPVTALFIQNTNPLNVAPEQALVRKGFAREDLFTVVHEQFLTDTAVYADIVLPATMFLEHDDLYQGGGHTHVMWGAKLVEPPGACRSNHDVVGALAERLGAAHPGFTKTVADIAAETLDRSGHEGLESLAETGWRDVGPSFDEAHFVNGFAWPDGRYRFRPDWSGVPTPKDGMMGPWADMPPLPDHWDVIETPDAEHPFRLATSPARNFLNSTFAETSGSADREGAPALLIHEDDANRLGVADGSAVLVGNPRGEVVLAARLSRRVRPGVVVAEGLHPNAAHRNGAGVNTLIGADPIAPHGGAAFHDARVWIRPCAP
jgi:anaerobic selenocysteine-containing dehydrogenase